MNVKCPVCKLVHRQIQCSSCSNQVVSKNKRLSDILKEEIADISAKIETSYDQDSNEETQRESFGSDESNQKRIAFLRMKIRDHQILLSRTKAENIASTSRAQTTAMSQPTDKHIT